MNKFYIKELDAHILSKAKKRKAGFKPADQIIPLKIYHYNYAAYDIDFEWDKSFLFFFGPYISHEGPCGRGCCEEFYYEREILMPVIIDKIN